MIRASGIISGQEENAQNPRGNREKLQQLGARLEMFVFAQNGERV